MRAAEGKSLRELARYAAHLEPQPLALESSASRCLVGSGGDAHARAALGADAEARYESREYEGANETARRNRDAWTRSMFPEAPWPKQSAWFGGGDADLNARCAIYNVWAARRALVNPTDPRSGVVTFDGANGRVGDGGAPGTRRAESDSARQTR